MRFNDDLKTQLQEGSVIIVDDERDILDLLASALENEGCRVQTALSGHEAVEAVRADPVDVVITDIRMPGMDGLEVMRWMKKLDEDIEVIIMTGHASLDNAIAALRNDGAFDYLRKPLEDIDEISFAVSKALEKRALRMENKRLLGELKRQAAIVASSMDMMALLDRDYTYVFVNPAYAAAFGKTVGEMLGCRVPDVLGDEIFERVSKPNADRCLAGEHLRYQRWFDGYGERRIHVDVSYTPFRDSQDEVAGYVVHVRDTTERAMAEKALRSEKLLCEEYINSLPGVFYVFDKQGVVRWNKECERVTGYSRDEFAGMMGTDFFEGEDKTLMAEHMRRAYREGSAEAEANLVTKDGRRIPYHFTGVRKRIEGKAHIVGLGIDITIRKQAEQDRLAMEAKVQEAQKLESLGVLAGGIAHDFNNLMMGVLGNAELALQTLSPAAPERQNIKMVEAAATRASELANQMLAYSGHGHFIVKPVNLTKVVREMGSLLEASISQTTAMMYQLDESIPAIEADASQLNQVVLNLITNASEALEERAGTVTLRTGVLNSAEARNMGGRMTGELTADRYAVVEVSDTGVGMDAETVGRMFEPFFSTKFTGRGLGMAAVFGIVRGHNGAIAVASDPGVGTTVRVLFPVAEKLPETRRSRLERSSGAAPAAGTVLLVDDEPVVLDAGRQMLEKGGYSVLTARDGKEGVEVFRNHFHIIACVILDLTMPGLSGEEAFGELREINSEVPIILSTGFRLEEVEQRLSSAGFAGFLKKPYSMNDLMRILRDVLSHRPRNTP